MKQKFLIFIILNFVALAIGGLYTNPGVESAWYLALNKAPWTPPGWVFGAAWTTVMICFALFMTKAYQQSKEIKILMAIFFTQWVLNISWNPMFFKYQMPIISLLIIALLSSLIWYLFISQMKNIRWYALWILPYAIWILLATSLNAYTVIYN